MNVDVTVRETMTRDYVGVSESDDIVETAALLIEEESSSAIVLRGQDPVGMVTDRDILVWLVDDGDERTPVGECMTEAAPEISSEQTIENAVDEMFARSVSQLVVTDSGGELVGVLTQQDVVAATAISPATERPETARVESATGADTNTDDEYNDQGICERCGALTSDLASFNGQLLCADCRDI